MKMRYPFLILVLLSGFFFPAVLGAQEPSINELESAPSPQLQRLDCQSEARVAAVLQELFFRAFSELVALTTDQLTDEGEMAVRASLLEQAKQAFPQLVDAPETQAYLDEQLNKIALHLDRQLNWQSHIFEDPAPNAFAIPGGFVFVSTGLLQTLSSEAQLVGILAHELAHHELRHTIAHLQLLSALGLWQQDNPTLFTDQTLVGMLQLPIRARHEAEADAMAVRCDDPDGLLALAAGPAHARLWLLVFAPRVGAWRELRLGALA